MRQHDCRETDTALFGAVYGAEIVVQRLQVFFTFFLSILFCSILFKRHNWTPRKSCKSENISHSLARMSATIDYQQSLCLLPVNTKHEAVSNNGTMAVSQLFSRFLL